MEGWILVLLWSTVVGMAVMSVVLFLGKGSMLIAGYNTASKEEKAKYDEKKLGKVMGTGLSIVTVTLAFSLFYNFEFPNDIIRNGVIGVFVLTSLVMLILGNTICKKK